MWQITEWRADDTRARSLGVYGEHEEKAVWEDWDVWLKIAKTMKSKVFLYHNDRLVSSMDCREKRDEQ